LSQPFHVAEQFTGLKGVLVDIKDQTIRWLQHDYGWIANFQPLLVLSPTRKELIKRMLVLSPTSAEGFLFPLGEGG
jgi:hypothetical protein